MNKFINLEDAKQPCFIDINNELIRLLKAGHGIFLRMYYKLVKKMNISFGTYYRRWEYPWAIINSDFKESHCVLDAGCGNSPLLLYLYKRKCSCYGLDSQLSDEVQPASSYTLKYKISQRLSNIYPFYFLVNPIKGWGLSNTARALGFRVHYTQGDITNIPFGNNTFDRIFCISVIEHLSPEDALKAAREFSRVLKPQGLLIMTIDLLGTGLLWKDFIKASGLELFGDSDFNPPPKGKYSYDVVGFVLKKE